jgi:hypothetical protein
MTNWKRCTRRDKSAVYLNLAAAIAIRPFEEGFTRVYFSAGAEDNKLYFDVDDTPETLLAVNQAGKLPRPLGLASSDNIKALSKGTT